MSADREEIRFFDYFVGPMPLISVAVAFAMIATFFVQLATIAYAPPGTFANIFPLRLDWPSRIWTLVTSRLAHLNGAHLTANVLGLLLLGPIAERWLGRVHFLVFLAGTAILGGLAGIYIDAATGARVEPPSSIGASTGIWGVMGLIFVGLLLSWSKAIRVARGRKTTPSLDGLLRLSLSHRVHEALAAAAIVVHLWSLLQWEAVIEGLGQVGNAAHAAGLILGTAFALVWVRNGGVASLRGKYDKDSASR